MVMRSGAHLVVVAEDPQPTAGVVVDRRTLEQALVPGVRIANDRRIERVEVRQAGAPRRIAAPPRSPGPYGGAKVKRGPSEDSPAQLDREPNGRVAGDGHTRIIRLPSQRPSPMTPARPKKIVFADAEVTRIGLGTNRLIH